MQKFKLVFSVLFLAITPFCTYAQQANSKPDALPSNYYQLRFDIEEVGETGKVTNSRTYQTIVSTGDRAERSSIRTGNKVPVVTGSVTNDKTLKNEVQYLDVGVNIDVISPRDVGDKLALHIKAEISSIAPAESSATFHMEDPIVRQNSWESTLLINPGKPKVIFSSDNLDNKGKMQIELTATRID
jgi:hypothetical protein